MTRLGLALWMLCATAFALDYRTLQPQGGYVSDFALAVDTTSKRSLEAYLAALEQSTGTQFAIVTVRSLEGEPIEDFANNLYRHWGIGKKGKDEGLLLVLSINDKQHRLEIGRGLEPIITDGYSGSLLRAMRPALRESKYGDALIEAAQALGEKVAQSKGVAIEPVRRASRPAQPASDGIDIPFPVVLLGAFLVFLLFRGGGRGRGRRGGPMFMPFPTSMGGGNYYGGSSHGGFGGYDSGGGFSGFGGGDSGGGGASSDW